MGRSPNGHTITCRGSGRHRRRSGLYCVDSQQRTGQPHIFAIGDIVGQPCSHTTPHMKERRQLRSLQDTNAALKRELSLGGLYRSEVAGLDSRKPRPSNRESTTEQASFLGSERSGARLARSEGITTLLFDRYHNRSSAAASSDQCRRPDLPRWACD
ncbi:MAG: hypothetical protein ACJ0TD_09840 [Arenicellales bacterium]